MHNKLESNALNQPTDRLIGAELPLRTCQTVTEISSVEILFFPVLLVSVANFPSSFEIPEKQAENLLS